MQKYYLTQVAINIKKNRNINTENQLFNVRNLINMLITNYMNTRNNYKSPSGLSRKTIITRRV